jgi:hypothetical protein
MTAAAKSSAVVSVVHVEQGADVGQALVRGHVGVLSERRADRPLQLPDLAAAPQTG